jgi:hypothetical protein
MSCLRPDPSPGGAKSTDIRIPNHPMCGCYWRGTGSWRGAENAHVFIREVEGTVRGVMGFASAGVAARSPAKHWYHEGELTLERLTGMQAMPVKAGP